MWLYVPHPGSIQEYLEADVNDIWILYKSVFTNKRKGKACALVEKEDRNTIFGEVLYENNAKLIMKFSHTHIISARTASIGRFMDYTLVRVLEWIFFWGGGELEWGYLSIIFPGNKNSYFCLCMFYDFHWSDFWHFLPINCFWCVQNNTIWVDSRVKIII